MDLPPPALLVAVLRDCAKEEVLYPRIYADAQALNRGLLDRALDHLRLAGLVRLTDWVAGKGQGYAVTVEGVQALRNPHLEQLVGNLDRLKPTPLKPTPRPEPEAPTPFEQGEAARASLLSPGPPLITLALIFLNLLAFATGAAVASQQGIPLQLYLDFNTNNHAVLELRAQLGALVPAFVLGEHQWWRLLSHCFLHDGLLHLFLNMFFLFSVGPHLENMWGHGRFLFLYLVAGLWGGCLSVLFTGPYVASLGASGALCGLLTSMLAWIWLNRGHFEEHVVRTWIRSVLVNIVLIAVISMFPGIAAWGHAGGALAGLLLAYPMYFHRFGSRAQKRLGLVGMILVPAAGIAAVAYAQDQQHDDFRLRAAWKAIQRSSYDAHVLTQEIEPLLKNVDKQDVDKKKLEKAAAELNTQAQKLQDTRRALLALGGFAEQAHERDLEKALDYLQKYSDFLKSLAPALTSKLSNDAVRNLNTLSTQVHAARAAWEATDLYKKYAPHP